MTRLPSSAPPRVVLAPDVIGKGFLTPACRTVLERWRDGGIRPVVTRDLLRVYLRLLRDLGVPDPILRRWVLWFSAEGKSAFLDELGPDTASILEILYDATVRGQAGVILSTHEQPNGAEGPPWMLVDDFLS